MLAITVSSPDSITETPQVAIFQARSRLGPEPLEVLISKVAVPMATDEAPGAWLGGRRLVAIDGTFLTWPTPPRTPSGSGVHTGVNKGEQGVPRDARATEVEWLLAACDLAMLTGNRDRVLMLVARLGLRSVEVARLCLDDIDWWAGKFAVRGKAHTPIAFLCRSRWARR